MKAKNADTAPFVRLDFDGQSILYSNPTEIIQTRDFSSVRRCLERLRARSAAGFISYEAGHALEPSLAPIARSAGQGEPPLLWFGVFEHAEPAPPLPSPDGAWLGSPTPLITFEEYAAATEVIHTNIRDGDVYQVNFTFPCSVRLAGNPRALYAQLRERSGAAWSALVFTGEHWLVSCSPELFFTAVNGHITCRPMKGTAPPDSNPEALRGDPKNRAENLMIVDLVRNDLSRVAKPGTVKVPELFAIEHYPTVLQMTSTVVADLEPGRDAIDVLQTIFPCGSITGAPKIAAMGRIHELEHAQRCPRGPYTGSIGHVLANGDAELNVAIRTLVIGNDERVGRYDVGSAIVIDSEPSSEFRECLQKAAFVASTDTFQLIETFAFGADPAPLVQRHLDRMERSATELEFRFDPSALENALQQMKPTLQSPVRLRIALERSGAFNFETAPLPAQLEAEVAVSIVRRSVPADDFRLAHKTSARSFYDDARIVAGGFEVLFMDAEGYLTEGSFTNLFVSRGDQLLTPPLHRGLLPGILRQQLIEQGVAVEHDLRPAELEAGFWIGNSLRGLMRANLLKK